MTAKITKKCLPAKIDPNEKVLIYWSDDKKHYYLPEYASPHSFWLGLAIDGEVPADKRNNSGLFSPAWLEIKTKDKRKYHRELLRFSFWEVGRSLRLEEFVFMNDDMVLDYFSQLESDNKL